MRAARVVLGLLAFAGAPTLVSTANAQEEETEAGAGGGAAAPKTEPKEEPSEEAAEKPPKEDTADDKKKDGDKAKEDEEGTGMDPELDPKEKPGEPYFFLGLRFRDIIVPEFMIRIFVDGGRTVNVFTFGPEFVYRKDELEIVANLSYGDYSMKPTIMKGKDEDRNAFERVESDLKVIYGIIDILFEVWEEPKGRVALLIGGGVGLGGVFDKLRRSQVAPNTGNDADQDEPDQWQDCTGNRAPATNAPDGSPWCDDENDHYAGYTEPSWANGGSKPFIYPWIALPQISFRYKPIKQFQARADLGFAISSGFYFGLGAHYGF